MLGIEYGKPLPFFAKRGKVSIRTYLRMSVTVGVASSVANDVTMRTGTASAVGARCHNENDVTMTIAGLWRYGDWRHVATGCTALVLFIFPSSCSHNFLSSPTYGETNQETNKP